MKSFQVELEEKDVMGNLRLPIVLVL